MNLSNLNPPPHWRAAVYWLIFAVCATLITIDVLIWVDVVDGEPVGVLEAVVGAFASLLAIVNTPSADGT